jgi:galactonate dehydratase
MSFITKIETWITKSKQSDDGWSQIKPFIFLKLSNNEGHYGWGEAFTLPAREKGIVEIIHNLVNSLSNIESLNPNIFHKEVEKIADGHRGIDFSAATSAIEMSLWDIEGKKRNKPLYKILSSEYRDKVPVYATIWSEDFKNDETLSSRCEEILSQDYGGIKIYPLQKRTIDEAAICVSKIRKTLGFNIPLMLDLACPKDTNISLKLAPLIEEFKPYWFEEPVDGEATRSLKYIKNQTGLRIVTGEKQCGINHFVETLAADAIDIFNPDISSVGGIIDMIKIIELSNKNNVRVSPHCWNSMSIAASAMVHLCMSFPNTEMAEFFPEYIPYTLKFCDKNFEINNGFIELDNREGLGVTIDTNLLMENTSSYKFSILDKN